MRTIMVLLLLCSSICFGQHYEYHLYSIDFETEHALGRISIDTSIVNNSWQIGTPMKDWLSDANSPPNVIITDTIDSYPVNDSSVFSFLHVRIPVNDDSHALDFNGYYKSDCDTLVDYCRIELSPNNGESWIDLLTDDRILWYEKPTLTGRTDWSFFWINFENINLYYELEDSIIVRFTFISDDVDSQRGGLMFDDFWVNETFTGIGSPSRKELSTQVYPNPTKDVLTIEFENIEQIEYNLDIYNIFGEKILKMNEVCIEKVQIDVENLKSGIYTYVLSNNTDKLAYTGRFIVQ